MEAVNRELNMKYYGESQLLADMLSVSKMQHKDFKWA